MQDDARVFHNLCAALVTQRRWDEAAAAGRRATELRPDWADAWSNYGAALYRAGQLEDAVLAYRRAISLRPDYADAYTNLSLALLEQNRFDDAEAACHQAIRLAPDAAQPHSNLGNVLKKQSRFPEAMTAYRMALQLNPRNRSAWANVLLTLGYLDDVPPEQVVRAHREWAMQYVEPLLRDLKRQSAPFANDRDDTRRIRVGYVSPNLYEHAVSFFLEPLLAAHDRESAIEIFVYNDSDRYDTVTQRLRAIVGDGWRDVRGISDADLSDRIRSDRIDVLIDLAGHTRHNRLITFASRAAPVQITYLGYPATTGLSQIDFRLTDAWADPPCMTDAHFTENLLRLPRCAWCYRPPDAALQPSLQPPCLAAGHVTFGSFNRHHKISPATLDAWARLLRTVEHSRLLIKSNRLRDDGSRRRLMSEFTSHGVDESRVELLPPTASLLDHLAAYARVDVALDTFPYNGTTTTCESMYMGVPVIALAGRTHASRVGASLLTAVGLADLIADDVDRYVTLAAGLARDPRRLSHLRRDLRNCMASSPLMDAPGLARAVEAAYRQAWHAWCSAPQGAA